MIEYIKTLNQQFKDAETKGNALDFLDACQLLLKVKQKSGPTTFTLDHSSLH
jgi:hypothetical protein